MDRLYFQAMEKAFRTGIIVTVGHIACLQFAALQDDINGKIIRWHLSMPVELPGLPMSSPGNIPSQVFEPEKQAKQFILEGLGRERCHPRGLKSSKNGYSLKKRNADNGITSIGGFKWG